MKDDRFLESQTSKPADRFLLFDPPFWFLPDWYFICTLSLGSPSRCHHAAALPRATPYGSLLAPPSRRAQGTSVGPIQSAGQPVTSDTRCRKERMSARTFVLCRGRRNQTPAGVKRDKPSMEREDGRRKIVHRAGLRCALLLVSYLLSTWQGCLYDGPKRAVRLLVAVALLQATITIAMHWETIGG